jgi:hypothetical protein
MQGKIIILKIANKFLKNVAMLKHFGMKLKKSKVHSQNIEDQIKFGKCLLPFSSEYFFKNLKIYKTIILPAIIHGHETWSLTLREECRLWVFKC